MDVPQNKSRWPKAALWLMGVIPTLFWLAMLWCWGSRFEGCIELAEEDGLLENLQVILFLVAAAISAWIAWMLTRALYWKSALLYAFVALAFVWVTGEEISWGQRIFNIETPTVLESNLQQEMSLHNLPGVSSLIERWVLNRGILAVIAVSFLAWAWRKFWAPPGWIDFYVPHPILVPALLSVYSYVWLRKLHAWKYLPANLKLWVMEETREFILALTVVIFLAMVLLAVKRPKEKDALLS